MAYALPDLERECDSIDFYDEPANVVIDSNAIIPVNSSESDDTSPRTDTFSFSSEQESKNLYEKLREIEESEGVVNNNTKFVCKLCFEDTEINDGVITRECIHWMCKNCIRKHILKTKTVTVNCPYEGCDSNLQDREISSLLTQSEYANHVFNKLDNNGNDDLYEELKGLEEESGHITALEEFQCKICFTDIELGDGIVIRECLHQFCTDCIRGTINNCDDAVVKCPEEGCECEIQNREIRSLLPQIEFDNFLLKTLRIAETKASNTFHCKKPDCGGWAFCENNVNSFHCPICNSDNCLACQVSFYQLMHFK